MAPPSHVNARSNRRRSASLLAALTALAVAGAPSAALSTAGQEAPAGDPVAIEAAPPTKTPPDKPSPPEPEPGPSPAPAPTTGEEVPTGGEAAPTPAPVPCEPEPEPLVVVVQEVVPEVAGDVTPEPAAPAAGLVTDPVAPEPDPVDPEPEAEPVGPAPEADAPVAEAPVAPEAVDDPVPVPDAYPGAEPPTVVAHTS